MGAYNGSHFQDFNNSTFIAADQVQVVRVDTDNTSHEIHKLINWLTVVNFEAIHHDTYSSCTSGTGGWFLSSVEFNNWIVRERGFLWLQGRPGSGKTILSSIIIQYLLHMPEAPPERDPYGVVFIYCRHDDKHTIKTYLASIIVQLIQRFSKGSIPIKAVQQLYEHHGRGGTQPSKTELVDLLSNLVAFFSKVYIVLDALDEVPDHDQIDLITSIMSIRGSLLLTSRPMGVEMFDLPHDTLHFSIQDHNQADINTFLHDRAKRIASISRVVRENPAFTEEVCEKIVNMSKGMFLLARLKMDSLQGYSTMNRLSHALESLPSDLDATYLSTLKRIDGQDGEYSSIAKEAITWILYASRTLSIVELRHALAIQETGITFDERDIPSEDVITAASCGMVQTEPESRVVRLVHYTAYNFFRKHFDKLVPSPHFYLLKRCFSYLTSCGFTQLGSLTASEFDSYLTARPLTDYAYNNWVHHIQQCRESTDPTQIVSDFVLGNMHYPLVYSCQRIDLLKPSHVAAYFGLPVPLQWEELCNERTARSHTPLTLAAMNICRVNNNILDSLLSCARIDVNAQTCDGDTALMLASNYGDNSAVMALLSFQRIKISAQRQYEGIDVNLQNNYGSTALICACKRGHLDVVEALLSFPGILINQQNSDGYTALTLSSYYGHHDVVKSLLSFPGIDTNLQNNYGSTALTLACKRGHHEIVETLLSFTGVLINLQNNNSDTPLTRASYYGHYNVVKLLLSFPGIDVNLQNNYGSTALSLACRRGHTKIANLFLSLSDIDVNLRNKNGDTALTRASYYGHHDVMKSLMSFPRIDINIQNNKGSTALALACWRGYSEVVKILLAFPGINVNSSDADGDTAFLCACFRGQQVVVENLLTFSDIDVNHWNKNGQTALSVAYEEGYQGIVDILLAFPGIDL